jgi:hypothetical protein
MKDNNVNFPPHGGANLLAVYDTLERTIGVGLDTAGGSPTTGQGFSKVA